MEWTAVLQGVRMMRFRDVFGRREERELSQLEAAELLGVPLDAPRRRNNNSAVNGCAT